MADVAKIQEAVTAYVGFFNEKGKILVVRDKIDAKDKSSSLERSYWSDPVWAVGTWNIYNDAGFSESLSYSLEKIRARYPQHTIEARPLYFGWGEALDH